MAPLTIRNLVHGDVPQCLELCAAAGWNQTRRDWLRLMALSPEGCFAIDVDDELAATATVVTYGQTLGWIGMVLVRPAHRGKGFARALLQRTLDYGAERRVECLKLDATDLGEPVYRKLGFEIECGVERWVRQPSDAVALVKTAPYAFHAQQDQTAFGADRSFLVALLEREEALGWPDGSFALGRPGTNADHFGPCLAFSQKAGPGLLAAFVARHINRPIFWDRFTANAEREGAPFGFAPTRHLKRMFRGKNPTSDPTPQFALTGFELG